MTDKIRREPRIQAEMLVGVSAVLIGVCALGVSLYETSLMREEQRAAVMPLMELGRSYSLGGSKTFNDEWRLSLHAENVGIGPARILDFRVTVDEVPEPTWNAAIRTLIGRDIAVEYGQSTINGRTIPPDRQITMFELRNTELTAEIIDEFDRIDFEACFCSVFDECWTASYSTFGVTAPVETCMRSDSSFQE